MGMLAGQMLGGAGWDDRQGHEPIVGELRVDARRVSPGDVFVALSGSQTHGVVYVDQAAARGASLVLSDRPVAAGRIPVVVIPDLPAQLFAIACRRYPQALRNVQIVAVTGTNGKTSVTHLIEYAVKSRGRPAAVIGTVAYRGPGLNESARETTPHFVEVLRLLDSWNRHVGGGVTLAIEASSHALQQRRLGNLPVDVAVVTNVTRDHLDYHEDLTNYRAAKSEIFRQPPGAVSRAAVLPHDDDEFAAVAAAAQRKVLRFGVNNGDLAVTSLRTSATGTTVGLSCAGRPYDVELRAVGRFQALNLAAGMAALLALGWSCNDAAVACTGWQSAPGRMERVLDVPFAAFVDYAHTPDALESSLSTLREVGARRIICVFGCGGDRDAGKRPQMGRVAERLADVVIVTSDNPRSESPEGIAAAIVSGMRHPERAYIILDRSAAIRRALAMATPGDAVLIAGKGHETTQVFASGPVPFDDRAEIRRWYTQ